MFSEHRNVILAAVLSTALCAAQAQDAKAQARAGAIADSVSSIVGVGAGAPVNPLLPVLGAAVKAATFQHAESLPETERPRAYALAAAGWQGSAAGNACATVSVLSGGSFLPACIVVGVVWGWKTWNASERERRDGERCAALRASTRKPKLHCASVRDRVDRTAAHRKAGGCIRARAAEDIDSLGPACAGRTTGPRTEAGRHQRRPPRTGRIGVAKAGPRGQAATAGDVDRTMAEPAGATARHPLATPSDTPTMAERL